MAPFRHSPAYILRLIWGTGIKKTIFIYWSSYAFFSDIFVVGCYMKKFYTFSVGYWSKCVLWQIMFNFCQNFKLLLENLPFPRFLVRDEQFGVSFPSFRPCVFFPGTLYKRIYTHCLILDHGVLWGRGTSCCMKRLILGRFIRGMTVHGN